MKIKDFMEQITLDLFQNFNFVNVHINTRAKGNPMKAVRDGSIVLTSKDLQTEWPGVFLDCNHRIN